MCYGWCGIIEKVTCELTISGKSDKELNPMLKCDSYAYKVLQLVNIHDCTNNSSQTHEDG